MSDLIKGVLGGGWALLLGWLFPAGLSVGMFIWLVEPSVRSVEPFRQVAKSSPTTQSVLVVIAAATLGVLLNAMQTPLYRVLEGYSLWPAWLAEQRTKRHRKLRKDLAEAARTATGYRAGLVAGRLQRYPEDETRIVPTALGNAIRRFEVYGWDRYRFNTQTLWYRILAVVPDSSAKAIDTARANVDFFVSLLYGQLLVAALALAALLADRPGAHRLGICVCLTLVVAAISYRLAIVATDEWNAAVRAIADLGRLPLAKALGLVLPRRIEDERRMWRTFYRLERDGYTPERSNQLDEFRTAPPRTVVQRTESAVRVRYRSGR